MLRQKSGLWEVALASLRHTLGHWDAAHAPGKESRATPTCLLHDVSVSLQVWQHQWARPTATSPLSLMTRW